MSPELKFRVIDPSNQNLARSLVVIFTILIMKYFQKLDVLLLIIRKWADKHHSDQLNNYFTNQKDGVIIYELIRNLKTPMLEPDKVNVILCNRSVRTLMGFDSNNPGQKLDK